MEQRKMASISLMGCAAGTTPLYPPFKGGRLRALPVAETASNKEWQRSKFGERMRATNFGNRNRGQGANLAVVPADACENTHATAGSCGGRFVNRPYDADGGRQVAALTVWMMGAGGSEQEEVQMRLWEEMAKNRTLGIKLAWAKDLIRAEAEQKEAMRRVRRAALKLLGWLGVGLVCGFMAMACWFMAPRWTCIAPVVLTGLALWKAGEAV